MVEGWNRRGCTGIYRYRKSKLHVWHEGVDEWVFQHFDLDEFVAKRTGYETREAAMAAGLGICRDLVRELLEQLD